MKIVAISDMNVDSVGRLMLDIAACARESGMEAETFSGSGFFVKKGVEHHHFIGSFTEKIFSCEMNTFTGRDSTLNLFGTRNLLKKLDDFEPDIIHLHNLHGNSINLKMLFNYIKAKNVKVIWTLHDCWAFTGHCPHFMMAECEKWKQHCSKCPSYTDYPKSFFDNSSSMFEKKREMFCGVKNLTLVTPSKWLSDQVKSSFLKDYPVEVIYNGIDLNLFRKTESSFRIDHGIKDNEIMLLGVSNVWNIKKGLDVFLQMADSLERKYKIVLIGTNDEIDKQLPERIISVHHTQDRKELAEIYSAADVFINPTREEVFGLVNVESLACGTPVIVFNTGGCPEIVDSCCGLVVDGRNSEDMLRAVSSFCCALEQISSEQCVERAKKFSISECNRKYLELYQK